MYTIPIFLGFLYALQQVAALRCGKIEESDLKGLTRNVDPDDPDNFATRCHNSLCYTALFARLPDELQVLIWHKWRMNAYLLGVKLFMGDGLTIFMGEELAELEFIRTSFKWYTEAAERGTRVCWLDDIDDDLEYHWSPLAAVNTVLVKEAAAGYKMPRRIEELPAVQIRKEEPLCFNSTQPRYKRLKEQAEYMVEKVGSDGRGLYYTYGALVDDYDTWAGITGPAMKSMMRKNYVCPPHINCRTEARFGLPFLPTSYIQFLDELRRVMNNNAPFCFALNNQLPGGPETYWFMPGIKTDDPN